ncbi:hypothetical protein CJ255_00165 [Candidatus Viridilinea mediisalina]|uniref:Uncharacterized protein n=1 Tax=Candidatus Viridilinea mediisalina TaxID=2024553 RepID=A0A2A6RQ78_9CHLR|nr:hypothetical protein CJ255_00165 [Candidatus Viridilinea mediisalina]
MRPDLLRPPQAASPTGTSQQPASALDRARAALQAAAWEEAAAALNEAAQSDNDPAVRALLDEACQLPAFVALDVLGKIRRDDGSPALDAAMLVFIRY